MKSLFYVLVSTLLILVVTGCAYHFPYHGDTRTLAQGLPEFAGSVYRYQKTKPVADVQAERKPDGSVAMDVGLTVPIMRSTNGATKVLKLRVLLPNGDGPFSVNMILPISSRSYFVEGNISNNLKDRGTASVIILHGPRADFKDPEDMDVFLEQSVSDGVHVVDWIESRLEFNPNHIGLIGISIGGIKGALLIAVDPRIKGSVLCLTGGDLADIVMHTTKENIVLQRERYQMVHRVTAAEYQKILSQKFKWDPKLLAPAVKTRKVMLFLGLADDTVPFRNGIGLRHDMGSPETWVLVSGHYTAILYLPFLEYQSWRFLECRFKEFDQTGVFQTVQK